MDKAALEREKFAVFSVADYRFALPITTILKIVNCPPLNQGGTVGLGLVQLGSHTIRLLNLYREFGCSPKEPPEEVSFLIVVRSPQKELWGITLDMPPDLVELPPTTFRPVSLEMPFNHKTNWISHMAMVSDHKSCDRTLLLLDVHAIFQSGLLTRTNERLT